MYVVCFFVFLIDVNFGKVFGGLFNYLCLVIFLVMMIFCVGMIILIFILLVYKDDILLKWVYCFWKLVVKSWKNIV